jgi:coproporphyrinogen III oxidase-like Fe-S oxidoreductase
MAQHLEQTPVKTISLQETAKKNMSSVKKATLLSIIPGGGQIYNKSYWKVPVIYAGFGALGYSYVFYNRVYNDVRQAYIQKLNNEPITNPEYENVSEDMLYNLRESYRKSRDLSVIGMAGWYAFNLMDAAVDAHLKGFDVGEKLTLKVKPQYQYGPSYSYAGLSLKLNF